MATRQAKRRDYGTGGRVRRLPSGRYQARFTGPDGILRPAPQTFDDKQSANAWCDRQHDLVRSGRWTAEDARPYQGMTFRVYSEYWLEHRDLKARSRADYQRLLDRFLLAEFGDYRLASITPALVRDWYDRMDPSKQTTRARSYGLLRAILSTAYADDIIPSNPCRIRGGSSSPRRRTIRPLRPEQIAALAVAMPDRYRLMILLAGYCGMRSGEVRELRRKDIHLDDGVIRIERSVAKVQGEFVVGLPKSDAGVRDAVIPESLVPHLSAHLERFVRNDPEALLFPGSRTREHMNESSLYKVFYPAREAIGRPDLRFHDLRHTAAVLAAAGGATIAELQEWLGHSSPQAAMIYQHAQEDSKVRIAAGLSDVAAESLPEPISTRKTKAHRAK